MHESIGEYWVDVCSKRDPEKRLWFYHHAEEEPCRQFVIGLWAGVKLETLRASGQPFHPPHTSTVNFRIAVYELSAAGYDVRLSHPFKAVEL